MGIIENKDIKIYKAKAEDILKLKKFLKRSNKNNTDGYTRWEKN
jgi:hypothetical protein